MIRSFLITLLAIFVFIPTIQAADNADHRELLSKHYRLEKPEGSGPFPAVMMVSGCSGFDAKFAKSHYDAVQKRLWLHEMLPVANRTFQLKKWQLISVSRLSI
jgi:hypothetical protein